MKVKDARSGIEVWNKLNQTEQVQSFILRPSKVRMFHKFWQTQHVPRHGLYFLGEGEFEEEHSSVEIFLHSAFYDDREALHQPLLRILVIAENRLRDIRCLVWFEGNHFAVATKAEKHDISTGFTPGRLHYTNYVISCPVTNAVTSSHHSKRPSHVSVVTTQDYEPRNMLAVEYPKKLEEGDRLEFGHCMSVIYWRHNASRIVEWLELHRMWGVAEFNIYANHLHPSTLKVFEYYSNELNMVNIHRLTNVLDSSDEWAILMTMSIALNHCYFRNMFRYKHVVCSDTDEMIVPMMHQNYSAMIQQINSQQLVSHTHPSYLFRNVYFFTDFGPTSPAAASRVSQLHTQNYFKHIEISEFGYSAKSITSTSVCTGLQNHLCWKRIARLDRPGWLVNVDVRFGLNFHYKSCHFDRFLGVQGECARLMRDAHTSLSMRRFAKRLLPRVQRVLARINKHHG